MPLIKVDENIFLSQITLNDVPQFVKYLNDIEIYNNTLLIPFPYTKTDGEFFVKHCSENKIKYGMLTDWAIRNKSKKLIGVCSFQKKYGQNSRKDEIGYWLAKRYWNKGIMTKVILKLCEIGFKKFGLSRIEASVFKHNDASSRVLEKAGFKLSKVDPRSVRKGKKFINIKLYYINK